MLPPSLAWLNLVPSSSTKTIHDGDSVNIDTALRLGFPVCQPLRCRCGAQIGNLGLHPAVVVLAVATVIMPYITTLLASHKYCSLLVCRGMMASDRTVSPFSRSLAEHFRSGMPHVLTRLLPAICSNPAPSRPCCC